MGSPDQEVVITYKLSDGMFGSDEERRCIRDLTKRLGDLVMAASAGELDGDAYGAGEVEIFLYGPDASRLFAVIEKEARSFPLRPARADLHLGAVDDENAPRRRIDF